MTPLELVEDAIVRIEKCEPHINAFTALMFDQALAAARSELPEGPFRGVPFAVKDLGFQIKDSPTYEGNAVLKKMGFKSPTSSVVGERIGAAGFIVMGKTATPEFGAQPTTQPLAFGPTRNPWDFDRSVSGSSGGSGAAVAAGMVPAAHASDGGGSVRQPASWCGLVGLKPSRGRMPRPTVTSRLGTELAVTWTVRDSAGILDALHGTISGDLFSAPPPLRPYVQEVGAKASPLRIGLMTHVDHPAVEIHPEAIRAAENAARLLESLGHHVEHGGPERLFNETFLDYAEADYSVRMRATFHALWRLIRKQPQRDDLEPYTWARIEQSKHMLGTEHVRTTAWLHAYSSRIIRWWDDFDLLLTPTTGEPPELISALEVDPDDPYEIDIRRFARIRCFVRPFNVTGQPAISLPTHMTPEGLPQGIQLVAAPFREDLLIRVASQIEEAAPWFGRRPVF